jgi:hypothetical protein
MRIVSICLLASFVTGDECQSYCESKLNVAGCSGSYCKNQHACHGLFWVNESKSNICLQGTPGCSDKLAVKCTEASQSASVGSKPTEAIRIESAGSKAEETTTTIRPKRMQQAFRAPFTGFCIVGTAPPSNGGCACCK